MIVRGERGFLVDIRNGERAALASEATLAAKLRTELDRKTDLTAVAAISDRKTTGRKIWENLVVGWIGQKGF